MDIVKVKNLTKEFDGLKAVDRISFAVKGGEAFGLLGPNGAGKTTTIRILTGVLKPTEGNVWIHKHEVQESPLEAKQLVGVVPETANAYLDLSAIKNLLFVGELYGIRKEKRLKKAGELLELFELAEKKDQQVKTFSKGMRQRLILAMALMSNSKLLFLDEPTSGLDVKSARLIRSLIEDFNQQGKTIFLTTHNIEEANQLCDRVAIMNYGKIVAIDRPEKLKDTIKSTASVEVAFERPVKVKDIISKKIIEVKKEGNKLKLYTKEPGEVISFLVSYSRSSANKVTSLNTLKPSLEDVFVKITEGKE
jgi:ABC-2 type transport system ATP-binding protein